MKTVIDAIASINVIGCITSVEPVASKIVWCDCDPVNPWQIHAAFRYDSAAVHVLPLLHEMARGGGLHLAINCPEYRHEPMWRLRLPPADDMTLQQKAEAATLAKGTVFQGYYKILSQNDIEFVFERNR